MINDFNFKIMSGLTSALPLPRRPPPAPLLHSAPLQACPGICRAWLAPTAQTQA